MSSRNSFAAARAFARILLLAVPGFLGNTTPASALTAAATVRDANSIQLGDVTYRLDGVDAPSWTRPASTTTPIPGPVVSRPGTSWPS